MRLPYRPLAFCVVALAIVYGWHAYQTAAWLHVGIPRHFSFPTPALLPLYANAMPIDVADPKRRAAIAVAVAVGLVATLGTALLVAQRQSLTSCLLVALVGTWTTNVAVGHLRNDHAGFVAPFARRGLEYHTDVPAVADDPLAFVRNYPELARTREISHHASTHPPGGVLFLWGGRTLFRPRARRAQGVAGEPHAPAAADADDAAADGGAGRAAGRPHARDRRLARGDGERARRVAGILDRPPRRRRGGGSTDAAALRRRAQPRLVWGDVDGRRVSSSST